jgi:hypothetical protein
LLVVVCYLHSRDPDVGEGLSGEGKMTLDILADDGLLMVTGDIVPLDSIAVKVVEHGHAGLGLAAQLGLLPVVGLGLGSGAESAGG